MALIQLTFHNNIVYHWDVWVFLYITLVVSLISIHNIIDSQVPGKMCVIWEGNFPKSSFVIYIYKKILVSSKWTLFSLKLLSMTLIHIITVCNTCITLPWGLSIVYLFFSWDRISKLTEILLPSFRFFQIAYNLKKKERIKDNAFIIIKLNILHVFFFFKNTINFPQYLFIKLVTPDGKT